MATQRLWLAEPRRLTCLATVTAARGEWLALDRTMLAPTSRSHRHPQPADEGVLWGSGEKRRVTAVQERDGEVWHRAPGARLAAGTQVNLHLDADRRLLASRAHTALHLLLPELAAAGARLLADPEVKGRGSLRLDLDRPLAPATLAACLAKAQAAVAANHPVGREATTRDALHDVTPQPFHPPDPIPGPDPLHLVRIPGVSCYPCDGTHVERTGQVGRIVVAHAKPARGRFTVVARVH